MTLGRDTVASPSKHSGTRETDQRGLILLSMSHMFDDVNQGAIPAMLPFFILAHNLSYSAAAGLVLALTVSSSVLQPFLGQFSDRHSAPWLAPAGVFIAGAGVALSSIMPSYLLIALAIGFSGIGVAAFHPEASRFANYASGARRATGMSIFALGGNLGFAVGPALTTSLLLVFGLHGGLFLIVPPVAMALILTSQLPRYLSRAPQSGAGKAAMARATRPDDWGPFVRLTGAVVSRSIIFYGLNTFVPLYWLNVLHQPEAVGGMALTILFTAGAVGTLLGGWSADRYGRRTVVLVSLVMLSVVLGVFVSIHDVALLTALLVPLGMTLNASSSVMVVMGQEYLPNRIGTASGVTMGLAVSVGGFAAPFLGHVADSSGIPAVFNLLVFLPLLAIAFAATLPRGGQRSGSSGRPQPGPAPTGAA